MNKRLFSFILILTMLFTSFSVGASADKTFEIVQIDENVLEFLAALGFVEENEISGLDKELTRGEFADFAARLIPFSGGYPEQKHVYGDVIPGSKHYDSVMLLTDFGIINGVSAISFAPDAPITFEQACAIMIRLTGYEVAVNNGDYISKAKKEDIITDVKSSEASVTKADALNMLYNALHANIKHGNNIDGYLDDFVQESLLAKRFGIYEVTGILTDDGDTSIYSDSEIKEGWVKIGSQRYINAWDAAGLLGYAVTAYYEEIKGQDTVLYMYADEYENDTLELGAGQIADYSGRAYTYYPDDEGAKTKKASLASDFTLMYNGRPVTSGISGSEFKKIMNPECGSVKLVNTDGDKNYDIVFVESIETVVVKGYAGSSKTVYNKLPSPQYVRFGDIEPEVQGVSGNYLTIESIAVGNVLSIMRSIDGEYAKVIISTECVKGTLEEITTDNITVAGKTYEIAEDLEQYNTIPEIGTSVALHIRHDGDVAYIKKDDDARGTFAYLQDTYYGGTFEDVFKIKVFTEYGEVKELAVADKVCIDGAEYKELNKAYDYINNNKYALNHLVTLEFNSADEVTSIDCAHYADEAGKGEDQSNLHIIDTLYNYNGTISSTNLNQIAGVDETTKVFVIPVNGKNELTAIEQVKFENIDLEEAMISNVNANLVAGDGQKCVYSAYTTDETSMSADAIVLYRNVAGNDISIAGLGNYRRNYIVTKVSSAINTEGDLCWKIEYSDGSRLYNVYTKTTDGNKCRFSGRPIAIGDVIKFGTDKAGAIPDNQLIIMYSPSQDKDNLIYDGSSYKEGQISALSGRWTYLLMKGKVQDMNDRYIRLVREDDTSVVIAVGTMRYIVYDSADRQKVRFGDWTDINTVSGTGDEANTIIFDYVEGGCKYAYIIK